MRRNDLRESTAGAAGAADGKPRPLRSGRPSRPLSAPAPALSAFPAAIPASALSAFTAAAIAAVFAAALAASLPAAAQTGGAARVEGTRPAQANGATPAPPAEGTPAPPAEGTPAPPDEGAPATSKGGDPAFPQSPHRGVPASAWSLSHLYHVTVREAPLTERDVELYIAHLPSIEGLKGNPSGLSELLVATGWSESRLAYVASRVGLALLGSLDPEALKALDPPPFAMPTTEEAELVLSREQAIAKAFAQITRAARAREAPQQTAVRGRRRGT